MTLDELQSSLPNGLHDAELVALSTNLVKREAVIELRIDVGSMESPPGKRTEVYRPARIVFSGVEFVVIDPPDARYEYLGVSTIDAGSGQPSTAPCDLPQLPDGSFLCWLFDVRWNSFIRIAAQDATLEWKIQY
jgi:hypothetical protein